MSDVNRDDYFNTFGVLLETDLGIDTANPSETNYAANFLEAREFECELYCRSNSTIAFNYDKASDFQKKMWKKGVLYYANYVIHNSLIGQSSGMNNDYQKSISEVSIERAIMSSFAEKCFLQCGAISRKVHRGGLIGGYFGGYFG